LKQSVFIIAEAGVNHDGSLSKAHQLIDEAQKAGADAVKFQTFKADTLLAPDAPKANYQVASTGAEESQYSMLKRLELSKPDHVELKQHSDEIGIKFLSTPFDVESVDFLVDEVGLNCIKIPSGEITNGPLLWHIANKELPAILSTGMSTVEEIEQALAVISLGYQNKKIPFGSDLRIQTGDAVLLKGKLSLLHCTTEYPAPYDDVNLLALDQLSQRFHLPVGYSDHTKGTAVSIAAVARGATIIEKHFTLDKHASGPDHAASIEPVELRSMVDQIRLVELSLGDGFKKPSSSEHANIPVIRKSLYAKCNIEKGEVFTEENLEVRRPGKGVSPMKIWSLLGKCSAANYKKNDLISCSEITHG